MMIAACRLRGATRFEYLHRIVNVDMFRLNFSGRAQVAESFGCALTTDRSQISALVYNRARTAKPITLDDDSFFTGVEDLQLDAGVRFASIVPHEMIGLPQGIDEALIVVVSWSISRLETAAQNAAKRIS